MLSISGISRIFLCMEPTDMRKSFRGLSGLIYLHLGRPEDGSYYVFVNRRRTHVKVLYWDGDGLAIWYKRLEKGRFVMPRAEGHRVELDRRRLAMLLEGIVPLRIKPRFSLKKVPDSALKTAE
jgi:transposase